MKFRAREAKPLPTELAPTCPCNDTEWTPRKWRHWHGDFETGDEAVKHIESVKGPLKYADDFIDTWNREHRKWEARQRASAPTGTFVEIPDLGEISGPLAPEIRAVLQRLQAKAANLRKN